jgi:ribonucleotide monophosphatase NagD (HAD superfamily)
MRPSRRSCAAPSAANPDLIYPKAPGQFGFTAGSVALLLEAGFRRRLGADAPTFTPLGKPNTPIYEEARRRVSGNPVMVGDQLETDIAGALACGIDAALLTTGVTRWREGSELSPTWVLPSLAQG